jgi:hypothetical protein
MKMVRLSMIFLFPTMLGHSQNLSGIWEGTSHLGPMRLVIIHQGDSCFGYVFESSMGACTAHFEGKFNVAKKELTGSSPGFIKKDFGHGLSRYRLSYDSANGIEKLSGKARPKSTTAQVLSFGMSLHCNLYRVSNVPDTTDFMAKQLNRLTTVFPEFALQTSNVLTVDSSETTKTMITNRPGQVLHNINAAAGSIQCTLYDNGTFDHDTVTVMHNGKIILNAAEISNKPLKFEILLSKEEPVHEIVFYANNLGDIPPNTGLLLIDTKEKRYQLDLTADKNVNGKIVVRLQE